jgi:LAO/AO transport system kinase
VLDGAGFDAVLIETVGVGQSEVDVVSLADTTIVLLSPGMGDGVQAAKAGILEIADVFCVNKADRDGADQLVRELKYMISLGRKEKTGPMWRPEIVKTVAAKGEGADDLVAAIEEHGRWMAEHGELDRRRRFRAGSEIEAVALEKLRSELGDVRGGEAIETLAKQVVAGEQDPYRAADSLIERLRKS